MGGRFRFLHCGMTEHAGTHGRWGPRGMESPGQAQGARAGDPRGMRPWRDGERNISSEAPAARAEKSRYCSCRTRTADRRRWKGGGP